jgi:hypothetical protein
MLRRSPLRVSFIATVREEAIKAANWVLYGATETAATATSVLKGHNGLTPEQIEREEKLRQRMREDRERAAAVAAAQREAAAAREQQQHRDAATSHSDVKSPSPPHHHESLYHRLAVAVRGMASSMQQTFSTSAGAAAVIDHCTKAHAAEVAIEQGIDVKSVNVVAEKSAVGQGTKIVGYIEAPAATEEEVFVFAQKLQKECPAAKMHGDIEWRRR